MRNPKARIPAELSAELQEEAGRYNVPYSRYVRALLKHRKLLDMGNPEFVKDLYLK